MWLGWFPIANPLSVLCLIVDLSASLDQTLFKAVYFHRNFGGRRDDHVGLPLSSGTRKRRRQLFTPLAGTAMEFWARQKYGPNLPSRMSRKIARLFTHDLTAISEGLNNCSTVTRESGREDRNVTYEQASLRARRGFSLSGSSRRSSLFAGHGCCSQTFSYRKKKRAKGLNPN